MLQVTTLFVGCETQSPLGTVSIWSSSSLRLFKTHLIQGTHTKGILPHMFFPGAGTLCALSEAKLLVHWIPGKPIWALSYTCINTLPYQQLFTQRSSASGLFSSLYFSLFFGRTCSMWKFLAQRSNPSYGCSLHHSCSSTRSLIHCAFLPTALDLEVP